MILTGKEDLRVQKTIDAIYKAFEELLLEKEFEKITVTELAARARINKKTFYSYYTDLDALLVEIQGRISQAYVERVKNFKLPQDADKVIREFFLFSSEQGELYEKITCGGAFQYIRGQMIKSVRENTSIHSFTQTLPGVFMGTALLEIYKFWIAEGKSTPIEKLIKKASDLILNGLRSYGR